MTDGGCGQCEQRRNHHITHRSHYAAATHSHTPAAGQWSGCSCITATRCCPPLVTDQAAALIRVRTAAHSNNNYTCSLAVTSQANYHHTRIHTLWTTHTNRAANLALAHLSSHSSTHSHLTLLIHSRRLSIPSSLLSLVAFYSPTRSASHPQH